MASHAADRGGAAAGDKVARGGAILFATVLGATVANINLAVANVSLPSIGRELGASQAQLNWVAVGFTLGLAGSVLYLGTLADRYGRKLMFLLGAGLSVPCAALAAFAPEIHVLIVARLLGGLAAGMLFPTTLSLISAIFKGRQRIRAIALWSGVAGGMAALGPLVGGALLARYWWGSVFLISVPLALIDFGAGWWALPRRAGENRNPVDHVGGVLTVVAIGTLVMGINTVPADGFSAPVMGLFVACAVGVVAFVLRERRVEYPLFDLALLGERTFAVATLGGIIAFGSMMGALFVGQQFLQNVLGYSALRGALATLPLSVMIIVVAPPAGRLLVAYGGRLVMGIGLALAAVGFVIMLVAWGPGTSYWFVFPTYLLLGIGVGLAGPATSRALMGSVPVSKAGIASGVADLTRDLGGAVFTALMGALLTLRYEHFFTVAFAELPPEQAGKLTDQAAEAISRSFAGAMEVAKGFPQADANELVQAASKAFTEGQQAADLVGVLSVAAAAALVLIRFPGKEAEEQVYADVARGSAKPLEA